MFGAMLLWWWCGAVVGLFALLLCWWCVAVFVMFGLLLCVFEAVFRRVAKWDV